MFLSVRKSLPGRKSRIEEGKRTCINAERQKIERFFQGITNGAHLLEHMMQKGESDIGKRLGSSYRGLCMSKFCMNWDFIQKYLFLTRFRKLAYFRI